jgi:prefoldin subunit 5
MKTDFQEIERQWDSLDVVIESYQTRVNEIDSINKQMSKELASFEEYK